MSASLHQTLHTRHHLALVDEASIEDFLAATPAHSVLFFAGDPAERAALGDGYRVHARVVVWQKPDALRVPLSALFRDGDRWAVFLVSADRAVKRTVDIGHRGDREAEVLSGLAEGDRVVVHPGDRLTGGARVKPLGG